MARVVLDKIPITSKLQKIAAQALCPLLLALFVILSWFALGSTMAKADIVPVPGPHLAAYPYARDADSPARARYLFDVIDRPSALSAQAVITSQPSTCMAIDGDGHAVKTADSKMIFIWEGTPSAAYLVLTSCGVKQDKHHTVYVNGQPVVQVEDDPYSSACACIAEGQTGQGGYTLTYPLSDLGLVVNGWNYISITNDHDLRDDWVAYDAKLVLQGQVTQTIIDTFDFTSSYDGSERHARYQLPIGYDPAVSVPLLVSIAGTKEDQKWEDLYRFTMQANERGWLLLSPNLRNLFGEVRGRTASLENQHDIIDAIDYMKTHFAVDTDRVYMSGFSTGGGIAATVAAKYPHVFAAVADWAGPTDLGEWEEQVLSLVALDFDCWPSGFAKPCPFEWQRRSARSMTENLKHVPMAIVHGRADSAVPFEQSEKFYQKMAEYYDPEAYNKLTVWHDGGHADQVPSFDGLDWMAGFALNANPSDIMIRADEDKDYYWVSVHQRAWIGKDRDGWSAVLASYDLSTRVISATIQDQRLYENGFLPLDVSFDLSAMGFDPQAGYTIEDHNITTGDYILRRDVLPVDGRLTVSPERDEVGGVHHQYLIYPFEAPELLGVTLQQHVSPAADYGGVRDTYIYQYGPSENHATHPITINYGRSLRGLLKFDLDAVPPEADIKKAYLTLYLNSVSGSGSIHVGLYRLLAHWVDNEATWNLASDGQPWEMAGAQSAGVDYAPVPIDEKTVYQNSFCTFNLKPVLEDWLTVEVPNEGVLILGPEIGSGSTRYRFDSSEAASGGRRPRLEIWYMLPTSTPTPTATPTSTATPTPTPTATPVHCTIQGSVTLQGRPDVPHESWSVPLTVTVGDVSYSVTTDEWGSFALSDLTPGTYDIRVKNDHTLRNLRSGVTLLPGTNTVDFGTLLEGDANDDNYVNINDFSVLAAGFSPAYDARADFNEDGVVNINDFSLLAASFGMHGDIT